MAFRESWLQKAPIVVRKESIWYGGLISRWRRMCDTRVSFQEIVAGE